MALSSKGKAKLATKRKSFTRFLSVMEKEVVLQATQANKDFARDMTNEAKDIIENQSYNWEPLREGYLEYKIKHGYDPRTLIRTREYLESISWGVTGGKVWAGVPSRKIHKGSGMPLSVLARILEFGTATIPARPLWRPLLSKYIRMKPAYAKRYRKAVAEASKRAKKK